ncbi:hypothetical protein [Mucilaginibacter arboris]|uniref:Uncharacterized protein n=1 Tax=Mucilaginibacter arboris TaxID=2682090 RepID=A0A7K1SV27_9SPHI|nr:hypothetical protein [Mucilaginibacter arboris]MVN21199.1 hypothetical protein [Mucilaginibacter arboris]
MKNLRYLLVLGGFISCRNASTNVAMVDSKAANATKSIDTTVKQNLSAGNREYIDFNSVRINGKLPLITKTTLLYKLLGKPDSIVVPNMDNICTSFYDKPFKQAYIKKSNIEIYGDTAVVTSINFESRFSLDLKTKTIRLNHNTTLLELQRLFPNAVKSQTELDVDKLGKAVSVSLALSERFSDGSWLLFFKNGKLVRIDYFMPC